MKSTLFIIGLTALQWEEELKKEGYGILLTIEQVATILGSDPMTIWRKIKRGQIPKFQERPGGAVRVPRKPFCLYLEKHGYQWNAA